MNQPGQERAMTDGTRMSIRLASAFAAGALFDLFALRDAFPYSDRDWLGPHAMSPFWLMLVLLAVGAFALNLGKDQPGAGASTARTSLRAALDANGLLIPFVILLGATVARAVVVIRDTIVDPTSHNLLPFEFLLAWIIVGVPAGAGSMAARAASWLLDRTRAP
jgi:hypothetical protein